MRLVSYRIPSPLGPLVRIGAATHSGDIVDLELSYRHGLIADGATEQAAARISQALLPSSMTAFIEGGARSFEAARDALAWAQEQQEAAAPNTVRLRYQPAQIEMLAPVPDAPFLRDFMAFEEHLQNIYPKLGREIPPEWYELPVYYKGNPSRLGADGQDIAVPAYEEELDFEFELGLVIGKGGVNIQPEDALDHVFGMMIYNDFSARVIQRREMAVGLGPAKGKDFEYGHVFGPYLVTMDEIPDPYNLKMTGKVNGEVWCDSNTSTIHWKFEQMIAHASHEEYVRAGEIFGSGTVGNGSAAERGTSLKRGDVVELEVETLGVLRNRVV